MYKLEIPSYKLQDFFRDLIVNKHNNDKNLFLRARLLAAESNLFSKEKEYLNKAHDDDLCLMEEHSDIKLCTWEDMNDLYGEKEFIINISKEKMEEIYQSGINMRVSTNEMEKLYEQNLVGKKSEMEESIGRGIYNYILSKAEDDLCPYCSQRDVKTVDHYLPKAKLPSFSVTPINLVPACRDCNTLKLDVFENDGEKMLIHPYFDDISNYKWLKAEVSIGVFPITFHFEINDFPQMNEYLQKRVENQFKLLSLGSLYANSAGREFRGRVKSIVANYEFGGFSAVLSLIEEAIDTYKSENRNSWKTCMFEALLKSEWFKNEAIEQLKSYYQGRVQF
ncbi:HNH endonuclease [Peribacillus frigoritolerans]|uniref:HNH endonuclease n=1 Tax=Peribacillus frigoritolerans TaxID=450367 RepID=UPI003B8E7E5B